MNEYPEPKYSFSTHFSKVEKQVIDHKLTLSKDNLLNYLKTYSFYNLYREKYPDRPDPILVVE